MDTNKFIEKLEEEGFVGVDVNLEISLFEYYLAYNPNTNILIQAVPINIDDFNNDEAKNINQYKFDSMTVDEEEIKESLEEIDDGFFDCVGTTKEDYYKMFKNSQSLVYIIQDLNSYNGKFNESFLYEYSLCEHPSYEFLNGEELLLKIKD